jgi:putative oxidoreductase
MASPDSRANLARRQAEVPLNALCKKPSPALFTVLAIVMEIGAGLLMLMGYKTRLVPLGLAFYVLIAGFIAHHQLGDLNQFQHFMKNMAIGSLAFVAFGGAYSLDARKSRSLVRPSAG